jgi:uncharacterized protein YbjT (DUF2867 family)
MKILVVGASQGTGALAAKEALERGHEVTAFARSPDKLKISSAKLTKRRGDFHDANSVMSAVEGHDAVIITASFTSFRAFRDIPNYFSKGTRHVIDAMKKHGVKKLVILSALGVGDSRALLPFIPRVIAADFLLKQPFRDHDLQETMARESGLDWVVARPGRLTNGAAKRRYFKTAAIEAVPSSISRADVADFLVEAAVTDKWNGKSVQIGG